MANVDFVNGPVSQHYLANPYRPVQPWGHTGRDNAVNIGSHCYAIAPGRVVWCGAGHLMPKVFCQEFMMIAGSPDSGNVMFIQHDGWVAGYFHLSGYPAGVDDGVDVVRGQVVAFSGNTGRSTGPHLHVEVMIPPCSSQPMYSRFNPTLQVDHENRIANAQIEAAPLNSRRNGPSVANMRSAPKSNATIVGEIPAGRLDTFTGYAIGDTITIGDVSSNIWYMDMGEDGKGQPRYVWAGLFTEQKISGLPNKTSTIETGATLKPNQRLAGPAGAQVRATPDPNGTWLRGVAPGETEAFTHFTYGTPVTVGNVTSNLWYKDSLGYTWAGVFTEQKTDGLIEFIINKTPEPVEVVIPSNPVPAYSFAKDLDCVTEVVPAGKGNYEVGNFPASPNAIYIHQFVAGDLRYDVHIGSVLNEFRKEDVQKSAQLAIEGKKITQIVKYGDRAYHAGPVGNNDLGFETYGGQDEETLNSVALAIYQTEKKYNKTLELKVHNSVMATQCGDQVDLIGLRKRVDLLHGKVIDSPPPVVDTDDNDTVSDFLNWLKESFNSRKK